MSGDQGTYEGEKRWELGELRASGPRVGLKEAKA